MGKALDGERDYVADATAYAQGVVSGEILACRWIKAACQRQLDDLERNDWEYHFDSDRAWRICYFIELLPHIQGQWKTWNIVLEPWQCFVLTTIFGWVDDEGRRRFRKALVEVPRKNAKTTIAAGVGLYLLALDDEPGAQVYSAATTRDQAKISWDIAKRMVERSPGFQERYGISPLAHSISIEGNAAFFKPLSRDADTLEGLNPHGAVIDELHAHKTREVFDVLDEATGSRRQPLLFIISTEGDNSAGVFAEQVDYAQQILEGRHKDETYFAVIYTIDPEDDWVSPEAWRKANPNLGVSVFEKDLAVRCGQAQKNAESQSSFLIKRLNVRVGAGNAYFNMLAWKELCYHPGLKIEDFYRKSCIIGLDLASKIDVAAKISLFDLGKDWAVFGRFYIPEDAIERGNPNYDIYRGWVDRGYLTLTPGNVIDFEYIERDLKQDGKNFHVTELPFDPYQATQLATRMMAEGLPMIEVAQNVRNLSEPMKELGARILSGKVKHDGNPVLSWMMGNVVARLDAKENVYPRKVREENKIDGSVALIMAVSRKILAAQKKPSVYATRGLLTLPGF